MVRAVKITFPHLMAAPHDAQREARLLREAVSPHVIPLVETLSVEGGRFLSVKRSADLIGGSIQCLRMTTTSYVCLATQHFSLGFSEVINALFVESKPPLPPR